MLLLFELKKIIKRLSFWGIVGIVVAAALISMSVTLIFFRKEPAKADCRNAYANLSAQLQSNSWQTNSAGQKGLKDDFENKLGEFHTAYRELNTVTSTGVSADTEFADAYLKFLTFADAFEAVIPQYWLFHTGTYKAAEIEVDTLYGFFVEHNLPLLNAYWEELTLFNVLKNMLPRELTDGQLAELNELIARLNNGSDGSTAYINAAYKILHNNYALSLDANFNRNLAEYTDFEHYNKDTAKAEITLNEYLIEKNLYDTTAHAFVFGDIYNGSNTVSLFDFIFTNLEIIGIPLAIIAIIFMSCAFFTDIYTQTIIESVSSRRRRISVIISKILAVWLAMIFVIVALTAIYTVVGILGFGAAANADIAALFNNKTPFVMKQVNYFVLYLLSILFKLSVFMLAAGLFSLSRARPTVIVGLSLAVTTAIILCNALLGASIFYQFVPLLAIEPIKYAGAELFMSPMPTAFNILYTLPVMAVFAAVGFFQLVYNFSKKDF